MSSRRILPAIVLAVAAATSAFGAPAHAKWPPWISIETPVNPFDPTARGAIMLVHAIVREGTPRISDVSATAEGVVNGARRSLPLRLDTTSRPGVFAIRRQWPAEGTWLVRVVLAQTTALVTFDATGAVASIHVPTNSVSGQQLPRAVGQKEIDSTLAAAAKR